MTIPQFCMPDCSSLLPYWIICAAKAAPALEATLRCLRDDGIDGLLYLGVYATCDVGTHNYFQSMVEYVEYNDVVDELSPYHVEVLSIRTRLELLKHCIIENKAWEQLQKASSNAPRLSWRMAKPDRFANVLRELEEAEKGLWPDPYLEAIARRARRDRQRVSQAVRVPLRFPKTAAAATILLLGILYGTS